MRALLEKAIVHLLNEEPEQAADLFHKFVVGRSRQIHEGLRQNSDKILDENYDMTENYFTEDDLNNLEDTEFSDDAENVEGDVADLDADASMADDDLGDLEADADVDADLDGLDGELGDEDADLSVDEKMADLKSQLDAVVAQFSDMLDEFSDEDTGDEFVDDTTGDDFGDTDVDVASDGEGDVDVDVDTDGDVDADVDSDEDFDDITESIVKELNKVSVSMDDGKEVGAGKSISQNRKSTMPTKKASTDDAKPVSIKVTRNDSFTRETPPTVKDMKKTRNTKKPPVQISKEGDKSADLNKDYAGKKK